MTVNRLNRQIGLLYHIYTHMYYVYTCMQPIVLVHYTHTYQFILSTVKWLAIRGTFTVKSSDVHLYGYY